ncbi:hypothetical protein IV203_034046 [Nitzschia inconspicua]|uniref:Uncharacterized protein n=1 Tax=Nitzschia inconspicua TaxID=303405 RepID=A0A9K3M3L5_9STRA|nr:hypothetical protein IV203_034046 [Nitzschia inconspicua]
MSLSAISKYHDNNIGLERFTSDSRQLGGLMMLFGFCLVIYPQVKNAQLTGGQELATEVVDGVRSREFELNDKTLDFFLVLGGVCQVIFGCFGLLLGYLSVVHDFGSLWLTRSLILVAQTSWIPLLADLAEIVIRTQKGISSNYVHSEYDPTLQDIRFFGAMGFFGIIGWYVGLMGGLSLIAFALHALQSGNPGSRNRAFYQSRLVFYSIFSLVAAGSQLLLGVYAKGNFGSGPLPQPVSIAMYVIVYPEIAITCGSVQAVTALFGFARAAGVSAQPDNHLYQYMTWLSWLMTIAGTVMTQVYLLPGGEGAGLAPTVTVLTFGVYMLTAFLDFKMRNLPFTFPSDYYNNFADCGAEDGGITSDAESESGSDEEKQPETKGGANETSIEASLPGALPVCY